jgi:5-methylthioadenosine/S-adenosylhomocysteine deaminase
MSIVIQNGTIITLDRDQRVIDSGYLLIEDDKIKSIGAGAVPVEMLQQADHLIDASQMAIMPGMVNAHTHLFQTFIRGLGDDLPLYEWLNKYIWPVAAGMTVYEAKLSGLLGIVENIRSGVTAVIDNQYVHNTPDMDDAYCQAAEQMGIRFLLARGWTDRDYHPAFLETVEEIDNRLRRLIQCWNNQANGMIRVEPGPLSQAKVTNRSMQIARSLVEEFGVGIHMHTAETQGEVDTCLKETGIRPIEWLDQMGCLGPQTQVVHAVWLSDHEIDLIAERGAKVVHCPVSNMYLASGTARIPEMRKNGISVALATDGPGSNNNQDMLETLKTTALLHKLTSLNAHVFLPEDILWMACQGGADAFGQADQIGSLEVGKKADVVMVDLNTPFAVPVHRPLSALVYNANGAQVDTVIVNGKLVMARKKILVLDEQALLEECQQAGTALVGRFSQISAGG